MKVKTSDLIDATLDWAVAKCVGWTWHTGISSWFGNQPWLEFSLGTQSWVNGRSFEAVKRRQLHDLAFSTNWAQGGPIIEQEQISLDQFKGHPCRAYLGTPVQYEHAMFAPEGEPLIAAMRCFCRSKLGDEADVPEELL